MTKSPKVFAKGQFQLAFNNRDCIYSDTNKKNRTKYSKDMLDYFANEKKVAVNLVDYFTGKINDHDKVNLIIEDGSYATDKELNRRKEFIGKQINNSNLWKLVVSFNNDYIDERISLKDLEKKMINEVMPRFIKKLGFDKVENMMYQISLHGNTDNYHFHIAFMEKKPNTRDKNGNLIYRRFGKLKKSDYNYLRNLVAISIERDYAFNPMLKTINKDIEEFKQYFSKDNRNMIIKNHQDILLEENILLLGKMLNEKHTSNSKIKYNSINDKEIKELTKNITNYIFANDEELSKLKKNFKSSIDELHNYLYKTGKSNNLRNREIDYSIIENKKEYLNNYIYNYLVNYSKSNYKYKSKDKLGEDIIQEIILANYKKNKGMSRKDILHNYYKNNKLINKQEIKNAIKNINYEMEQATNEFHKLFINDNDRSL